MIYEEVMKTAEKTILCDKCSLIYFNGFRDINGCRKFHKLSHKECRSMREYLSLERRFLSESGAPERLLDSLYHPPYAELESLLYMKGKMKELLSGRWFMLIGKTGLGKSFAAAWAMRTFLRVKFSIEWISNLKGSFYWIPVRRVETFIKLSEQQVEFYEKVKNATLVVLDDIGEEAPDGKPNWKTRYISYLIEERYDRNKPTIFTTNLQITPENKERIISTLYGKRVFSRLEEVCTYKGFLGEDIRKTKIKGGVKS